MDPQGLLHALGASVDNFRRNTGAELDFVNDMPDLALTPEQENQVFHIVQEALSNVARHAGAKPACVHLAPAGPAKVRILVEDDGSGLVPHSGGGSHYGMDIMAERARRIGGALEVSTRAGGGTRVLLEFPVAGAH
jgi:two-component system nitrate/nitrite sensor histidine kinase NarX